MVTFLDDRLAGDVWQARRNAQNRGGKSDPHAELRAPHDGMSGPEWQAARNAQVNGAPVRLRDLGLPERPAPDRQRSLEGGAKRILDLIAKGEGTAGADGYDTTIGYGQFDPKRDRKLTEMTLGEVKDLQKVLRQNGAPSTAVGRYQVVTNTLSETQKALGLPDSHLFTPDVQDRFGRELLQQRGLDSFFRGELAGPALQLGLAGRWASLASDSSDLNRGAKARIGTRQLQNELDHAKAEHLRFLETDPYITQRIEEGYLPAAGRWR